MQNKCGRGFRSWTCTSERGIHQRESQSSFLPNRVGKKKKCRFFLQSCEIRPICLKRQHTLSTVYLSETFEVISNDIWLNFEWDPRKVSCTRVSKNKFIYYQPRSTHEKHSICTGVYDARARPSAIFVLEIPTSLTISPFCRVSFREEFLIL